MEIELFEGTYLHLPPFYITAIAVIIIYLLIRWTLIVKNTIHPR